METLLSFITPQSHKCDKENSAVAASALARGAGARLQINCVSYFISVMRISSVNPMFDRLFESSYGDDSNKWSNIGFTEEITQVAPIEFI